MSAAPLDLAQHPHFSPWVDSDRNCSTCRYSIGMNGPHLFCQRHEIVVTMACGSFERAPGADDVAR